jgi:hypothetical protein
MYNYVADTERSYINETHSDPPRVATLRPLAYFITFPFDRLMILFTHGRGDKFASVTCFVLIDKGWWRCRVIQL